MARLANFDVAFIRHANTNKAEDDLARKLTDLGRTQCAAAASGYMSRLLAPTAPFALTSPAVRCTETAKLVLAQHSPVPELEENESIYDGMLQPGAYEAFSRLGYASLFAYLSDGPTTKDLLDAHGEQVVGAMGATVTVRAALAAADHGTESVSERSTLCVFGHAVYLNAAALRLATLRAHPAACLDEIMHTSIGEACGIWVGGVESRILRIPDSGGTASDMASE